MLQTQISRDIQHNFLIIKNDSENFSNYQAKMIQNSDIEGLLPFQQNSMNGERSLRYEITGLQNLSQVMEKEALSQDQMMLLFHSIFQVVNVLSEYLLREDDLVLNQENIYLKLPEYKVYLCYYPGYRSKIKQQFVHLFEYLMSCINYKDKDTVYLVYSLYMKSKEADSTLQQLNEVLHHNEKTDTDTQPAFSLREKENPLYPAEESKNETPLIEGTKEKKQEAITYTESIIPRIAKRIGEKIKSLFTRESDIMGETAVTSETMSNTVPGRPKNFVKSLGEDIPKPISMETMLVSLRPTEYESIHFPCIPCYIGSADENIQVHITKPGISRYHIRIKRENETYYIKDLNSTYGTKINGEKLIPEQDYELHDRDIISLADLCYEFQYSILQECMLKEYNS